MRSAPAIFEAPHILNLVDNRPDATEDGESESDDAGDEWKPRGPPQRPTGTVIQKPTKPSK